MTVQQRIARRVMELSDEGAEFVGQLLNCMSPAFFAEGKPTGEKQEQTDPSRRFGAGKGIIRNTEEFDSFNDEIAALFERTDG